MLLIQFKKEGKTTKLTEEKWKKKFIKLKREIKESENRKPEN